MYYDIENEDLISIVRNGSYEDLKLLSEDIREFLINKVSKTGGHLASNLGIVELTIALHRVYNTPTDKIIFDVGHQAYVHKILTGRGKYFDSLRQFGGLSGFPKVRESEFDVYETGHSSTSVSAALGMATARDLNKEDNEIVAVIGDGSMTGGLVYEALNNAGGAGNKLRIILNDNGMSIAHNVGGMSKHLTALRTSNSYLKTKESLKSILYGGPAVGNKIAGGLLSTRDKLKHSIIREEGSFIEDLGVKYFGPVDGYDFEALCDAMHAANKIDGPTLIHVITKKGKGYEFAEKYPRKFHGIASFDRNNGKVNKISSSPSFSSVFGNKLNDMAEENEKIVAICAAMGTATGLGPFYETHPDRFFDVGIAEEHAIVFAAGLARSGFVPVCAIYSSFLQRAIDQIIEDVCLQNLHVVFAVDRSGLVGADGETHHGMFDISYFNMIPNMTVLTPCDGRQLEEMLEYAINECTGPVAIRYPRGTSELDVPSIGPFNMTNEIISEGKDITILAVGSMLDEGTQAAELLRAKGFSVGVTSISVIKPFINSWANLDTKLVITIEDNVLQGGFGQTFSCSNVDSDYKIQCYALPDEFIEHGSVPELRKQCGIDVESIVKGATEYFERKA